MESDLDGDELCSDEESHVNTPDESPQGTRTQHPRQNLCYNCGELGHSKKKCPVPHVSDADRILIDEQIRVRKKAREAERIKRAKYRNSPKGKKKEREYEQSEKRKESQQLRRSTEEFKAQQQERNEQRKSTKQLLKLRAENIVIDPQYPDALVPEEELARIDAEYDFDKLKRKDNDVFLDACPRMSYDYTTNNCCVVCDCDWPKAFTTFYSLDDAFLPKLRARVALTATARSRRLLLGQI